MPQVGPEARAASRTASKLQLRRLSDLLRHAATGKTKNTSVRIPEDLIAAQAEAASLGLVEGSFNRFAIEVVFDRLEAVTFNAALEEHFQLHPGSRPDLIEVARAGAALTDDPLRHRPDLIEVAAARVVERDPAADADDVLLYATALLQAEVAQAR